MGQSTRQKIVEKTAELLEVQGYHGTGLNQIIKESGAPRGSLYYYFPEGKEELAAEAIARKWRTVADHTRTMLATADEVDQAVYNVVMSIADQAESSDFCSGAPLAAVALETAASSERLRNACQKAYQGLIQPFEQKLRVSGYSSGQATELATVITATIEGAIIQSRTQQRVEPLKQAALVLKTLLGSISPTS